MYAIGIKTCKKSLDFPLSMLSYWTAPISKSLKYINGATTKNKINLTRNLRYFYFTQHGQEKYMELEYSYKGNLTLDEKEEKIFSIMKEVLKQNQLKTTLRVAGGWVRDKVRYFPFNQVP
jgi:hypothetical protein